MKHNRVSFLLVRAGVLAVLSALPLAGWCAVAGQFQFVAGDVRILGANGQSRAAQKGQDISEGETVVTGANASAQLKMIDGGLLALRPDSQLKMDVYAFKGREDGTEKANMSLVKGGLRAISGLIGKTNKQNYAITTPTATIGIRGTDHEPVVIAPPPPGAPALPNPPGTYNQVNAGSTIMSNQAGFTIVNPNQVGFAGALNQLPSILASVPDFYRVTPLPVQRRPLTPGSQSDTGAQNNTGNDSPGTTSSASGSAGGEDMRVSSSANPPNGGTTPAASGSTTPGPVTPPASGKAPGTAVLTGQDAQGNSANFSKMEQQNANGITGPIHSGSGGHTTPDPIPTSTLRGHYDLIYAGMSEDDSYRSRYSSFGKAVSLEMQGDSLKAVRVLDDYFTGLGKLWLTLADGTVVDQGQDNATGLSWGRWNGGQIKYKVTVEGEELPLFTDRPVPASGIHYIFGAKPAPEHLAKVLTGSYDYVMIGGTKPTDNQGNVGTLNNASLKVNFTNQLVEQAIIGFSMLNDNWDLSAENLPLQGSGQFSACTGCTGNVQVAKNGGSTYAHGFMEGTLTGSNLNGAAIRYQVTEEIYDSFAPTSDNIMQGVAALGVDGTAPNANPPYRATGISTGWKLSGDSTNSGDDSPTEVANATGIAYRGTVEGGEGPLERIIDTGGEHPALTEFVGRADYTPTGGGSLVNTGGQNSAIVHIGSATHADVGHAIIDGVGVSWGRWEGGSVDIYARTDLTHDNKLGSIDNSGRSIHWMAIDSTTGPLVNLPLSGAATYSLGSTGFNTAPTDTNGHTGILNTATVIANFTTMRVEAQVDLSINAANINIHANNMVLSSGGGFSSTDRILGVNSPASVSCGGSGCGSATGTGYINGQLLGQNAGAAAIAYGAAIAQQTGSFAYSPGMVVNGVAVLKK